MFFIIALLITVAIFVIASRFRVPRRGNEALGRMSDQWLVEHRAARRL
jgi:hypothetical protein